ncbi:MAG: AMP-dependent synthetase, partial [Sphingomonadales bacterium]
FGLPDERFGEVPAAVYMVRPGERLAPEELCDYLRKHIAAFKLPVHIWEAHEQLPRLGTQKVDKRTVKATYAKDYIAA